MSFAPDLADPTAGEPAEQTTSDVGMVTAPEPEPRYAGERTFTQADVDRIAANERSRARRQVEREYESRVAQAPRQEPVDPVQNELRTIKQQMTEFALDSAIGLLSKQYPDFEQNLRKILEVVADKGLDKASNLSIPAILELAYRYWQHDNLVAQPKVDIESIKKQSFEEGRKSYLRDKTGKFAATPTSEGAGGGTPASDTREKRSTKKGALDAALERVTKQAALVS